MLFIVRFVDKPEKLPVRHTFLPAHLEWLTLHSEHILIAGSLRDSLDANPKGAMWIVDADNKITIETLITTDPFWIHGLRESVEILHWSKAFKDLTVPI